MRHTARMVDVVVCYGEEDGAIAHRLIASLHERGWSVGSTVAPALSAGDEAAEPETPDAARIIVLWSKHAAENDWLTTQARRAARRRRLISGLLDDARPPFVFPTVRPIPLTDDAGRLSYPGLLQLSNALLRSAKSAPSSALAVDDAPPPAPGVSGGDLHARLRRYEAGRRLWRLFDDIEASDASLTRAEIQSAKVFFAAEMLGDDRPAPDVQWVLTETNAEIYRRIISSARDRMAEAGWGDLPVPLSLIVMGSGGRGENYLFSDQDNGFILGDYPDEEHGRIDTYFRELAERLSRRLDDAGLPYCTGYCMAVNPLWRKTLPQWAEQISLWITRSNFIALRFADILLDFRVVWGDEEMGRELRRVIGQLTRDDPLMLQQMTRQIAVSKVALGFFGNIALERDDGRGLRRVNAKHAGIIPLVETIRVLALRENLAETSTLARIRALRAHDSLDETESADLSAAYHTLADILLRKEIAAYRAGQPINYDLYPDTLTGREQILLLDSLRAVRRLRRRVRRELLHEEL